MIPLRRLLAAAVGLLVALPLFAFADCQNDSGQLTSYDLELRACDTKANEVDYETRTDKGDHPTPQPPADKALIYILGPSMMGHNWRLTESGRE